LKETKMMDPVENSLAVVRDLVSFGQQVGVDVEPLRDHHAFQKDLRAVSFWRKDETPGSGPANQSIGTLNYAIQGPIALLPNVLKDSASAFHGSWHETGTFENIEQAFALLKAWLIDKKEVDCLPTRRVRSYGIG
jgi:hypothetical protein